MHEMQNSIKKREFGYPTYLIPNDIPPCPVVAVKDYVPTFMSFIAKAEDLKYAYWEAKNIFALVLNDKTLTTMGVNHWTFTTAIKAYEGNQSADQYVVLTSIVKIEGLEQYSFTFKRIQGDPLGFRRIWTQIEQALLLKRSADGKDLLFHDYVPMDENDLINRSVDQLQTTKVTGAEKKIVKK